MTLEEVKELESAKGFQLEEEAGEMCATGTIANQPNTKIRYFFNNDSLIRMSYYFSSADSYQAIETGLIDKYGEAKYTSENGLALPAIKDDLWGPSSEDYTAPGGDFVYLRTNYSQRLIEVSDDQTVMIEHYVWESYFKGNPSQVFHYLYYRDLTESQLSVIENRLDQASSDL